MRVAIAVAPSVGRVIGVSGPTTYVRDLIVDRFANEDAFEGERLVRLPRRFTRRRMDAYNVAWFLRHGRFWDPARPCMDPPATPKGIRVLAGPRGGAR